MPKKSYAGGVKQHIVLFGRYVMRGLQPVRDENLVVSEPRAREMSIDRLEGVCSGVLVTFYCRNIFYLTAARPRVGELCVFLRI
jgi:hypothetical protein